VRQPGGATVRVAAEPAGEDPSAFARLVLSFEGGRAAVFARLFDLAPDGSRLLLYATPAHLLSAHPASIETALLEESGGFVGNSAAWLYERGGLGPTLAQGGDGTAERRLLETAALALRQFRRLADFGRARTPWDLLVLYVPFPDDLLHVWLGLLDPTLKSHDPDLAARLRPFLDRGLALLDDYVGAVTAELGPEVHVAIASDHGQVGVDRVLRVNAALRAAGLAQVGAEGQVDLARTQALFFADSGYIVLNRSARPGGTVTPEQEDDVVRRVRAALAAVRGPSGETVVREVIDARGGGDFGLGPPYGGDLYLSLAPGCFAVRGFDPPALEVEAPGGEHQGEIDRPGLLSALLLHGPGIRSGTDLGTPRAIDIAPTLACLLGLDPPAQAEGQALAMACEDLARP
jgi:hypothetical protein